MCHNVSPNLRTVPLRASVATCGVGMPSIPPTCPIATWTPTPLRKPMRTVRDRKFARNPSRATRATKRKPAARSALRLASASH